MEYNRKNLLKKIIEIQDITIKYRREYIPYIHIYKQHIQDQYHISYGTFSTYLGVPAKAQLEKMEEAEEASKQEIN